MRNFIAYTLILNLIFPAYCFSSPSEVSISERLDEVLLDEEIIDKVMLILGDREIHDEIMLVMEDGKVKMKEIKNLAGLIGEKVGVSPSEFDLDQCILNIIYLIVAIVTTVNSCI
jgi:hypothetical protein